MTAVEALPPTFASPSLIKMEDRKRPSTYDSNDSAPPLKKQATANGNSKSSVDADMPWKDDLEVGPQFPWHIGLANSAANTHLRDFKKMRYYGRCKNTSGRRTHSSRS